MILSRVFIWVSHCDYMIGMNALLYSVVFPFAEITALTPIGQNPAKNFWKFITRGLAVIALNLTPDLDPLIPALTKI